MLDHTREFRLGIGQINDVLMNAYWDMFPNLDDRALYLFARIQISLMLESVN